MAARMIASIFHCWPELNSELSRSRGPRLLPTSDKFHRHDQEAMKCSTVNPSPARCNDALLLRVRDPTRETGGLVRWI